MKEKEVQLAKAIYHKLYKYSLKNSEGVEKLLNTGIHFNTIDSRLEKGFTRAIFKDILPVGEWSVDISPVIFYPALLNRGMFYMDFEKEDSSTGISKTTLSIRNYIVGVDYSKFLPDVLESYRLLATKDTKFHSFSNMGGGNFKFEQDFARAVSISLNKGQTLDGEVYHLKMEGNNLCLETYSKTQAVKYIIQSKDNIQVLVGVIQPNGNINYKNHGVHSIPRIYNVVAKLIQREQQVQESIKKIHPKDITPLGELWITVSNSIKLSEYYYYIDENNEKVESYI